jgi:hypothetical protein
VLSYLATYKDLPEETAVAILADHALAARLQGLDAESLGFSDAVESRIVELNRTLLEEKVALEEELRSATARSTPYGGDPSQRIAALEEDLAAATSKASAAEARSKLIVRIVRFVLAFAVGAAGLGLIYLGPEWVSLPWPATHPNRVGLAIASTLILAGISWMVATDRGRTVAIGGAILGGLIGLTQIIDLPGGG